MNREAIEWLDDRSNRLIENRQWSRIRHQTPAKWHGPLAVRKMIELRPIIDRCEPAHVTQADYSDPERWWI